MMSSFKPTILYVEDEDGVREQLERFLKSMASEVSVAKDGDEGLKLYKENDFDIVISDINMPIMNGLEMAKEIKEIDASQHIVFTTAHSESSYFMEAIDMQVDGYILKPIDYDILETKLNTIIEIIKDRIELERYRTNLEERVKLEVDKNHKQQLMLLRQSRLAQMGEMISMIAHQWRQPLNTLSILSQTIVLKYELKKLDDENMEFFDVNSNMQIQNMSKTIDDFRNFFKPEKEKTEFIINSVIDDIIELIQPILTLNEINIAFDIKEEYKTIGYQNELGQAILNIINNAKDALVENKIGNKKIEITLNQNDKNTLLTISDNAGGVPEDIIEKIFDPYFSTKEEKNGTGLGLYMSKMIIEDNMGGKLKVSNTTECAVFEIEFISSKP
ncbi:MAG: response regulator [Campylobacterota bacterium]|nr:response regulator [Campylobacterota bacterium]